MSRHLSDATKAKIAESQRRAWQRPDYREAKVAILRGNSRSDEGRAVAAASMRRKNADPAFRAKVVAARQTPEYRQHMSERQYKGTPFERVMWRTDQTEGCWLYPQTDRLGYGVVKAPGGKNVGAHRVVYESLVGPVPDGLELDHLCAVRNCVNPAHLEPVTHAENVRRGYARRREAVA